MNAMDLDGDEPEFRRSPSANDDKPKTSLSSSSSLFPLSHQNLTQERSPNWLINPSFSFDVSKIEFPTASYELREENIEGDDDKVEEAIGPPAEEERPRYGFLESTDSETERRRKKKRKRRKDGKGSDDGLRKSSVRGWAGLSGKMGKDKDYYFDVRGDRDNLVFGSLYRMDVARFQRHALSDISSLPKGSFYMFRKRGLSLNADADIDGMDNESKSKGRYYSTKYLALERHKNLKRVRFVHVRKSYLTPTEFVPFTELAASPEHDGDGRTGGEIEESLEDEVMRKNKEFNKSVMDFPHDVNAWIKFADYQDKVAAMQPTKASRTQALDKKVSVLEKAVEINPDNEELLLCLMKAYSSLDSGTNSVERWKNMLMRHPSSTVMWKEFLKVYQGDFSRFKVSDVRKMYAHAIRAISGSCLKLGRQKVDQPGENLISSPELIQLEEGLVDIFVSLCRFEWQTGHRELATGLFQAEIDYCLFPPSLVLTEQSKLRLFEHFWNGGGARLGENGAVGWGKWLEEEEENRQKARLVAEMAQESERGGWTGWSDPKLVVSETNENTGKGIEVDDDSIGENREDDMVLEDDFSSLLEKLGIDISSEASVDVKDSSTWKKWSEVELSRDSEQWMPVREKYAENQDEEVLSRVIAYEDVSEFLFSLSSERARFCLVSQFIDHFDGPMPLWCSTNSSSWTGEILGLEVLPKSVLEELQNVVRLVDQNENNSGDSSLGFFLKIFDETSKRSNILKFIQNAALLCLKAFPRNHLLQEVILKSDSLFEASMSSDASVTPTRALAKSLLKGDRQDLLLCGVYARTEAAFGCMDASRKVFDMALASIDGLFADLQVNACLLYFWYAEMELSNAMSGRNPESSKQRAVHILSCLGCGVKYIAFTGQTSSMLSLRARQGFKEKIKVLRSSWAHGDIKEHSIALICAAALFESLTSGWPSAAAVFEEAFSMVLPGRRSQSHLLESLYLYYIVVLKRHLEQEKLSRSWRTILQGLELYPYNPKVFSAFIEVGFLFSVSYKIRRSLDDSFKSKPSVIAWLFSFVYELGKTCSRHRIHALFERALQKSELQRSVLLWRSYLAYELINGDCTAAKRVFFRAIHACPWSKILWLDGFEKLSAFLTAKELGDLQEVMRDKELNLRTDIYEILLQDEAGS